MKSRLRQKIQEVTTQGLSVVVMVDCGYLPRNGRLAIKKPSPLFFPRKPLPPPLALSPPTFSPPYSPGRKISYISLSRGGEGGGRKKEERYPATIFSSPCLLLWTEECSPSAWSMEEKRAAGSEGEKSHGIKEFVEVGTFRFSN